MQQVCIEPVPWASPLGIGEDVVWDAKREGRRVEVSKGLAERGDLEYPCLRVFHPPGNSHTDVCLAGRQAGADLAKPLQEGQLAGNSLKGILYTTLQQAADEHDATSHGLAALVIIQMALKCILQSSEVAYMELGIAEHQEEVSLDPEDAVLQALQGLTALKDAFQGLQLPQQQGEGWPYSVSSLSLAVVHVSSSQADARRQTDKGVRNLQKLWQTGLHIWHLGWCLGEQLQMVQPDQGNTAGKEVQSRIFQQLKERVHARGCLPVKEGVHNMADHDREGVAYPLDSNTFIHIMDELGKAWSKACRQLMHGLHIVLEVSGKAGGPVSNALNDQGPDVWGHIPEPLGRHCLEDVVH
ncbi:MAG: hypothetical protein FRX49_00175 [Trebouxia sp. A1-2]|nr:MAG: hypothetical protein FRX49_00175 [Trebouxia sp. A1-2]